MKLYLLRHADAATLAATDDQRTLSKKGLKQAKCVANFCRQQGIKPDLILSSPLPRAQQTAKPVATKLDMKVETAAWLAIDCQPEDVLKELDGRKEVESIMLVGHEPDLGLLATALLGSGSESIRVRKGSLMLLEVAGFRAGGAHLEWSVPVQLM